MQSKLQALTLRGEGDCNAAKDGYKPVKMQSTVRLIGTIANELPQTQEDIMKKFINITVAIIAITSILANVVLMTASRTVAVDDNEVIVVDPLENYYPHTAVVRNRKPILENWQLKGVTVEVEDIYGNIWQFDASTNAWKDGDICAMIMNDNGTALVEDDEIVKVFHDGHIAD